MNKLHSNGFTGVAKRGWAVACLGLCLAAMPAFAQRTLGLTTDIPAGPFERGDEIVASFTISQTASGSEVLTAMGVEVEIPDGWGLVVDEPAADVFVPRASANPSDPALQVGLPDPPTGDPIPSPLSFFWNDLPALPVTVTFTLIVGQSAALGQQVLSSQLEYRFDAEAITPAPETDNVTVEDGGGPVTCGDANNDGNVNIFDALHIQQFLAGLIGALNNPANAEINGTPPVNIFDALRLRQFLAQLVTPLCL